MNQMNLFQRDVKETNIWNGFVNEDIFNNPGWPDAFGKKCHAWAVGNLKRPIRTLSLFSGAGGLDIGFHDAGFSIERCIEIEKKFAATLIENYQPDGYFKHFCQVICDDIRNYLPEEKFEIDFIIGGPPCQTFSAAGRRASGVMGTDDARGQLFHEYVRLLKFFKPKGFLFENVYGITGAQGGVAWRQIQEGFREAGYRLFHRVLDAADYGVPQHRERLFIIGLREGEYRFPRPTHGPESSSGLSYYSAGKAITNIVQDYEVISNGLKGRYGHLLNEIPPGLNYSYYTKEMGHPHPIFAWRSKFSDFLYKADPEQPIRTLKAQGGQYTGPFHWENRPFSLAELKRLQTFPDNYKLTGNRQIVIKQLGNSVPSQLARILALSILNQIFGVELPFELPTLDETEVLNFRQRKAKKTKDYKEKANTAILNSNFERSLCSFTPSVCRVSVTDEFDLIEDESGFLAETYIEDDNFIVNIQSGKLFPHGFEIEIVSCDPDGWDLGFSKIKLMSDCLSEKTFVAAWKVFEKMLSTTGKKADLVQLNGYYQYSPSIKAKMDITGAGEINRNWAILASIVSGEWCRNTHSSYELGHAWNVGCDEVLDIAQFLRHFGYEVRNSKTNPQVPLDHFLIPYPFPTLNKMSVQLRKSLT